MAFDIATQMGASIASNVAGRALYEFLRDKIQGRKKTKDFLIDRFPERGQEWMGIHNGEEALDGVVIMADDVVCPWWNNQSVQPRIVVAGGGGNVLVPNAASNPMMKVVSMGKVKEKRRYLEITQR